MEKKLKGLKGKKFYTNDLQKRMEESSKKFQT